MVMGALLGPSLARQSNEKREYDSNLEIGLKKGNVKKAFRQRFQGLDEWNETTQPVGVAWTIVPEHHFLGVCPT